MGPLSSPLVRSGAVLAAALTAFGLVGCGSDGPAAPASAPAPAASSSAPAASPTAAASETATPSASPSAAGNFAAVAAAGRTALAKVSGATVVSIETDREGEATVWEVSLVTRDGDEQDVDVSADGSAVVKTSAVDRQDAGDRRENRALVDGAELDLAEAVEALPGSVTGGSIDELTLDTDGGRVVWEAEVRDADNGKHEVTLDAGSGDVVRDRT